MMSPNDPGREFTAEEKETYEEEWESIDGKVLLAQILAELQAIRLAVTAGDSDASQSDGGEATYECTLCQTRVPAGDRERHASSRHRVPPGEWRDLFKEVDGE